MLLLVDVGDVGGGDDGNWEERRKSVRRRMEHVRMVTTPS
jgi:hypothetical protein